MRLRVDSRASTKPGISDLKGPSPFSPKETRAWQIPKDALLVMFFYFCFCGRALWCVMQSFEYRRGDGFTEASWGSLADFLTKRWHPGRNATMSAPHKWKFANDVEHNGRVDSTPNQGLVRGTCRYENELVTRNPQTRSTAEPSYRRPSRFSSDNSLIKLWRIGHAKTKDSPEMSTLLTICDLPDERGNRKRRVWKSFERVWKSFTRVCVFFLIPFFIRKSHMTTGWSL